MRYGNFQFNRNTFSLSPALSFRTHWPSHRAHRPQLTEWIFFSDLNFFSHSPFFHSEGTQRRRKRMRTHKHYIWFMDFVFFLLKSAIVWTGHVQTMSSLMPWHYAKPRMNSLRIFGFSQTEEFGPEQKWFTYHMRMHWIIAFGVTFFAAKWM